MYQRRNLRSEMKREVRIKWKARKIDEKDKKKRCEEMQYKV